jgi:ketosteroid isomerase-like protein
MPEDMIRKCVEDWAEALRRRDIEAVMSAYAPDIVSFDIVASLRYAGAGDKRRAWLDAFAAYDGPIGYEVHELDIVAQSDLAFAHSLNRVSGTLAGGHVSTLWLRWTACFRQIDGVWLIVHDHASIPAKLEDGRALMGLMP